MRRWVAAGTVAVLATGGLVCAATRGNPERDLVERYGSAWKRGDYATMYRTLTDDARRRYSVLDFARLHREAAATATAAGFEPGTPREHDGSWRLPMKVRTRVFGLVSAAADLPVEGSGEAARIAWAPNLAFPGVRPGERLTRDTQLPPRADLLARDGRVLAGGPDRTSALGPAASAVTGELGPIPPERAQELRALGVPEGSQVGVSGLERILDRRLLGHPGGVLRSGARVLGASRPVPAAAVRTTIAPSVQEAAVTALGGRLGGIVAIKPRTGEVLAFVGIAFSGLQPPGSTFKIVTLTAALEAGIAKPTDTYPVQTATTLSGVELQNANGEACGGTLVTAFAHSCNSVFAPLGARLGAQKLVEVAERFGFNRPPHIPGAAMSTIPPPAEIGDDLAVGSSAIGQGRVQATALQMAAVAAAIGLRGREPALTVDGRAIGRPAKLRKVTDARVARTVEKLMLAVVRDGTGTVAAIDGVKVAGKTGTAELKSTQGCEPDPDNPESCPPEQQADTTDTDAWFAAYAPAGDGAPRVAVGVLLVSAGAGGDTAAPAAREVIRAALRTGSS